MPRGDGVAKVAGQAKYTADFHLPQMAFAKVLRSPVAHARILSIDASAALARPGVIAVATGQDLAALHSQRVVCGTYVPHRHRAGYADMGVSDWDSQLRRSSSRRAA